MTDQIAYSVASAAAKVDRSVTTIKRAIASGDLRVRYLGQGRTRPSIAHDDLVAWVNAAPTKQTA